MRISDWSSDVCSSDLPTTGPTRHITKGAREPPVRGSEAVPASERRRRADADAVERGANLFLEPTEPGLGLRLATFHQDVLRVRGAQQPPAIIGGDPHPVDVVDLHPTRYEDRRVGKRGGSPYR